MAGGERRTGGDEPDRKPRDRRQETGRLGEEAVAAWLERRRYRIVARNVRVGRLELDIIAQLGGLLVFCEVRSRRSARLVHPAETFDHAKRQRIRRAAALWLEREQPRRSGVRFDAATVVFDGPGDSARIEYYEDAF